MRYLWLRLKEILPKTSCSRFILQDNGMEFKNDQLMSVFNTLGIKCIYSNPYYLQGNGRIENVHNFLKCTIAKFIYGSWLRWDDVLPQATYCYNVAPSMDDLESPYYLIHGHDLLERRLSDLQNYCRYMDNQPRRLAVQELLKLWKLHAKLLGENRRVELAADKKITSVSDLKIGYIGVYQELTTKAPSTPTYIYDHWVAEILNDSTVLLTTPDGKEKKCNICHVKLVIQSRSVCGLTSRGPHRDIPQIPGQYQAECHKYRHQQLSAFIQPDIKTKHDKYVP